MLRQIPTSKVFVNTFRAWRKTERYVSSCGGTRSGKTFANLQLLLYLASQDETPTITSVVSETIPHLKRGAIRDFQTILGDAFDEGAWNKSDLIYTLPSGSIIEFFSADQPGKVHGPARDRLFLNEVQNISLDIARQLFVRTRGKVLMDYNPTSSFWANEVIESRPNCVCVHSTYEDNVDWRTGKSFLTDEQIAEIESNRSDANWWTVYGEGRIGTLEGLIYTFEQIDEMPEAEGLREVWGVDFGFTCFQGDTLITTARGDIPIRDVIAGDLVLTRQGFQKVLKKKYNGIQEVIKKNIIFDNGESARISATYNHNFNVNGKWKQYGKLEKGDTLFTVSPLTASSIEDTLPGSIPTTTITNGRRTAAITLSSFTRLFGRKRTEWRSQRDISSTTSTGIRSTTIRAICNSLRLRNTMRYIAGWLDSMSRIPITSGASPILRRTGRNAAPWLWRIFRRRRASASNAAANTSLQTSINASAQNNAIIAGNIPARTATSISSASAAARSSAGINTSSPRLAPLSAPIASLVISSVEEISRRKTDVYDLWVDGVHEYFANGILVHNCDPTAIVRILADTGRKIAYIDEQAYETGMLNAAISQRLKDSGARPGVNIWADAAEPKSIAEIGNDSGLTIRPCDKGAPVKSDKRKFQIQWLQGWQLRPTKRSVNWIKEARNYTWAKDRNGTLTGFPIDGWDHLLDATRYALFSEFAYRAQEGQYSFTKTHRGGLRRH